ncbi:leukocidin family pore-forming toxin [Photobacterium lipolyticum]|uniref:Cytolysin and hemolysin HlyA Pore-forming toxin n=1 Tax=Photobacterium lipolyticum TaxID=266810 RepID=A0A2T3N0F1_9GAMM|nr:leukocidin family pore-forming toxin [Photobacterium lipolyticum]PSW05683.1 cytolysin and hemolysin HlyA Pore-forming toxin [Photobacterium lipolyticum]
MIRKTNLITLAMMGLMATTTWAAGIDEPAGSAINMLSSLQDVSSVNYINAEYLLDNDVMPLSLTEIKTQVLNEDKRYFIDFSNIATEVDKNTAKSKLRHSMGIGLTGDMIIISAYKGELMFSQLDGEDDPNITLLEGEPKRASRNKRSTTQLSNPDNSIPNVAFYLHANRRISDRECNLTWNTFDGPVTSNRRCNNPNISLIYKVNLQRSLPYDTMGSSTPDAKIVRIGIDDSTQGTGIHLNNTLGKRYLTTHGIPWPEGGNEAEFVTTAIARNYEFNFNASNGKANVLRTVPASNLNANYNHKEVSTFNFGISGGVEVNKDGPKAKLDANASWSESKWLTFDTRDYRVERSSNGTRHVAFKWAREQYPNAESIKNVNTHGISAKLVIPANLSLINPIGYASFTPKMEVIYKASPTETGTTTLTVDSAVDITGFRYSSSVTGFFGVRTYHSEDSDNQVKRVNKNVSFVVDWEHPVFTGGRPVNLQLASFNNKCISADHQQNLITQECDEDNFQQAFIFNSTGQYISAQNTKLCLDGEQLDQLQTCSSRLSQRWQWGEGTSQLQNLFTKEYLGHNKATGKLSLVSDQNNDIKTDMYSSYVNVFKQSSVQKN